MLAGEACEDLDVVALADLFFPIKQASRSRAVGTTEQKKKKSYN